MESSSAPLVTEYFSPNGSGRSRRRRFNSNACNYRSWWTVSCLILMSMTFPFFIPFFFLASCLGLLLLMPLSCAFLLIFLSWHKLIQIIMQSSSLGQYDPSLYEPIKKVLVFQLARIAEWAEQKASYVSYIACPRYLDDQYVIDHTAADDNESDANSEYVSGVNRSQGMVSESHIKYMVPEILGNIVVPETHDFLILPERRMFTRNTIMLGHHMPQHDEDALICRDVHHSSTDDVMYWYNPLGSIFNPRENQRNVLKDIAESNLDDVVVDDDGGVVYLNAKNPRKMIQKKSKHVDSESDDTDQKMLSIQDLHNASNSDDDVNDEDVCYIDAQRTKSSFGRIMDNGDYHDFKHELLNINNNVVEEKHEILCYPSRPSDDARTLNQHIKNIMHSPSCGSVSDDNVIAPSVMNRLVKPCSPKQDCNKNCTNLSSHPVGYNNLSRFNPNGSYKKKAPTLLMTRSSSSHSFSSSASDGSLSPSSRPSSTKTMVVTEDCYKSSPKYVDDSKSSLKYVNHSKLHMLSPTTDTAGFNPIHTIKPRKFSLCDSAGSDPTHARISLNSSKPRTIIRSPTGNSQGTVVRKETNRPNVEIRRQMRRELFPNMNNKTGKDSSNNNRNGSVEEPSVKSPRRLSSSILRNPCKGSNPSMHESPSTCSVLPKHVSKCSVLNKSSTDNTLQAFGRSKMSLSPSQGSGIGSKRTSSVMPSYGIKKILESNTNMHTMGIKRISAFSSPGIGHEIEEPKVIIPEDLDRDAVSSLAFACSTGVSSNTEDVLKPCPSTSKDALEHRYKLPKISTSELEEVWRRIVVEHDGSLNKHGNSRLDSLNMMDDLSCASSGTNDRTFFAPLELLDYWRTVDQQASVRRMRPQSPSTGDG